MAAFLHLETGNGRRQRCRSSPYCCRPGSSSADPSCHTSNTPSLPAPKRSKKFFREETTFLVSIAGSVAKPRALTWWIRPCTEPSVVRTKIRSEDETGKEELWALKRRHQYYFFKITFGFVFTLRKQIQQAVLAYDAEEWDENCPPDEIHAYQAHFSFKFSSPLPHGL